MPIQSKQKVITRRFPVVILGCLGLIAMATAVFIFLSPGFMHAGLDASSPTRPAVAKVETKAVLPSGPSAAKASSPAEPATPVNYYDHLPDIQTLIADFKKLDTAEIDQRISEVEQEITDAGYIEKANSKALDEKGYREFARLMQISDALYNVKIDRQLAALEKDLPISKKGA